MAFKLRLLELDEYHIVTKELDAIASGDNEILNKTINYCQAQITNPGFLYWNSNSTWLVDAWRKNLFSALNNPSMTTARTIAPIVIALRCMPSFQFSYYSGQEKSPNLVILGEDDGGLFGILRDADTWFDDLFLTRLQNAAEKYTVGQAMFLLNQGDLNRMLQLVQNVSIPETSQVPGFAEPWCSETRTRLLALVQRALNMNNATIVVSDE